MPSDLKTLADELKELRLFLEQVWNNQTVSAAQVIVVNGLSDISESLGMVQAGEFRVGNRVDPGKGFTGGRFGWPGFTYGSTTYFLAEVSNDVLQVGLSLDDGKVYAGAGAVYLDVSGATFEANGTNYIIFHESDDDEDVGYITGLQIGGYHRMDFFALVPAGSTEEAHVRFVATNLDAGLEATFNLYTDEPATIDLRGLASADQKLIFYGGLQIDEGYNIDFGTSIGTKIGTSATQLLSLWGVDPVDQPSALTAALTQIAHSEPGTPDYTVAFGTAGGLWAFTSQDKARTFAKVVKNLQVRVDELEAKAVAVGWIDSTGGGGGGGGGGTPGNTGPKVATAVETSSPTWTSWTAAQLNSVNNSYASYGATDSASGWQVLKDFDFGVPGGATPVGIKARFYAVQSAEFLAVEVKLSWDGGSSYTSVKTFVANGNPQYFVLGGPSDLWGRVWADTDFSNANFRMAVRRLGGTAGKFDGTIYIDYAEVTEYHEV